MTCGDHTTDIPVNAGQNLVQIPLNQSCNVKAELTRGKKKVKVLEYTPLGFNFTTNTPNEYNFNAFVAASPAGAGVQSSAMLSRAVSSWQILVTLSVVLSVFLS